MDTFSLDWSWWMGRNTERERSLDDGEFFALTDVGTIFLFFVSWKWIGKNSFILFGFRGGFLILVSSGLANAAFAGFTAVPVVDDLGGDDRIDDRWHDISENHHLIASLLDGSEDTSCGTSRQQKDGHGRQLARAALPVVGHRLDQLQPWNISKKKKIKENEWNKMTFPSYFLHVE